MTISTRFGRMTAGMVLGLAVAASPVAAQQTVNIGYTGPLSGGSALYGKNALSGIQMAVDEVNAGGGVDIGGKKHKLNIVALDDKYSPAEAAVNARRLRQEHKAPVVFIPHFGGTMALQAFNEREGFLIASYTSIPTVTERGNQLTLRIPTSFVGYMKPFSKIVMERYGTKVAIANATHDYAKAWTQAFVPTWKAMGGEVVAENPMDYNKATDFYSGVSKVLATKPDVLFIGGASEPTALVAKQARELGFKGGFIVMDQAKIDEMAKVVGGYGPLEGSVGVVPLVDYGTDATESFVKRYRERYNTDPGSEAGLNYFATHLVIEGMKQAGTATDARAIRASLDAAMKALSPQHNIYEMDGIDEGGAIIGDMNVATVRDGKVVRVRESELFGND